MDIATIASTALTLSLPFLNKTGEGIARKVGEDIWNVIKSPFLNKGKELKLSEITEDPETFKKNLVTELQENPVFKEILEKQINQSQNTLSGSFQQNVSSYGDVEKQINIQNSTGNIQM